MARMNEIFMKGVQKRTLETLERTGLTKYKFSKSLGIDPSFISALGKEEHWKKIPAWVWFLFQEVTNRRIEFNKDGEIIYIHDGYTLEEIHEHCRDKVSGTPGKHVMEDMKVKKSSEGYDVREPIDLMIELVDILIEDISQKERVYKLLDLKAKLQVWKPK